MAEGDERQLRVVMFPWFAHGHITPFLELAKGLASHGFQIFFVSTPLNIQRIKPHLLDLPGNIELVRLAMPYVEGLPAGVESSADAVKKGEPAVLLPLLVAAMDLLQEPFGDLLRQLSPDVVIHDFVQHWAPRVAATLAKPARTIFFLTMGVAAVGFTQGQLDAAPDNPTAGDLTFPPPGFPSSDNRHPLYEAKRALGFYMKHADGLSVADRSSICLRESWAVACNTCFELEGVYVEYLQSLRKRPVIPVGFLVPKLPPVPAGDICLQWLDRQPAGSVVVLAFGSEYVLKDQEVEAVAMGLQESDVSFLWVLPAGNDRVPGLQDQEKGLVVTNWAPQLQILNHPSTGAFLTHCGWNSIIEGLTFGVPLITLPMQYDQGVNAKIVKELKVGVEVRRNEEDGSFTKDDINRAIEVIIIEERGAKIKSNVIKIRNILTNNNFQISERNMRNFVSMLKVLNK